MKHIIGDLRERVCIERQALIPDDFGGYTKTWAQGQTVWAQIKPVKPKAAFEESSQKNIRRTWFLMRVRHGVEINPGDRLKWGRLALHIAGEPIADALKRWVDVVVYCIRRPL